MGCYCSAVRASGQYGHDLDFKMSSAGPKGERFPKLSAKASSHVVELGLEDTEFRPEDGGKHVSAEKWHDILSQVNQEDGDVVLFDVRNIYESRIGKFEAASVKTVAPDFRHFAQFPSFVDNHLDEFRGKRVMMYCTGGVRCERASSYLESKHVAKEVIQLKGGVCRYLERYQGEPGFFAGKNFVFDHRRYEPWHDDRVVGRCDGCGCAWDDYDNGPEVHCPTCRVLLLLCDACRERRAANANPLYCQGDSCDGVQIRCGCGCNPSYAFGPVCRRTGHFTRQAPAHAEQRSVRAAERAATVPGAAEKRPDQSILAPGSIACWPCWCGLGSLAAPIVPARWRRREKSTSLPGAEDGPLIEVAKPSEAQRCFDVVNQAWEDQYGVARYKHIHRVDEAVRGRRFLVVRDAQGVIVGGAEHDELLAGGTFRFGPLVVAPGSQGLGLGGALLTALERSARSGACIASEVEVRRGGKQGCRVMEFYKRAGYQPHGPRHRNYAILIKRFDADGEDAKSREAE